MSREESNNEDGQPPKPDNESGNTRTALVGFVNEEENNSNGIPTPSTSEDGTEIGGGGAGAEEEEVPATSTMYYRHRRRIARDATQLRRHHVPSSTAPNGSKSVSSSYVSWQAKTAQQYKKAMKKRDCFEWAEMFLPMLKWLKIYDYTTNLPKDIIAGSTVGVMIIPQSMSYAKLAGLPVEYGLYSALVPVYAYAFFGSSRQLAVGPVALVSLLLSTGLTQIIDPPPGVSIENDPQLQRQYNTLAVQAAFLVGSFYIVMGFLRLGFITIFLSHAVVSGFTTGAAVIIGFSQAKYILGYDVDRSKVLHKVLYNIFKDIRLLNYKTFLMGIFSILALVTLKNIGKTYPRFKWVRALGPLTVTVITILFTWIFNLDENGIPIVGTIPRGFPALTVDMWTPIPQFSDLIKAVIGITIVGFMESIAIAKQLASKHKYELDSSLELIGLGMANFLGAMFQGYPVTGSFSRSAVNNESGAVSGVSGMVTATLVMLVLLFLTPVFELMPLCVLASIVVSGVLGLLDYTEAIYLWKVHKFDFGVWVIACLGTMFLGVEIGLAIAVSVSLLIVTYESAYPHTAVLGRLPGTTVYRNVKQYLDAEQYDGIVIVRIDAPIYFANTQNVREKLFKYEANAERMLAERRKLILEEGGGGGGTSTDESSVGSSNVKFMIWELSPVSHVDTSALHILHQMCEDYKARGVQLALCNPNKHVMEKFILSGFADDIGRDHFFVNVHDAVDWCMSELDEELSRHGDSKKQTQQDDE